jgi:hypothetical protein
MRVKKKGAQVRLTLSAVGGVVTARAAITELSAPLTKPSVPPIGSLIYGHPKLRKPSGLRGDYELGLLTKRGSAATGDGDISYIVWLQRLWVGGDEAERAQTVETNERWPSSTVWQRTEVVGHCASLDGGTGGASALVTRWDADEGAFFTRADAEGCARSATHPSPPASPFTCRPHECGVGRSHAPRGKHARRAAATYARACARRLARQASAGCCSVR